MGEETPVIGLGIAWEGDLIYNHLYSAGSLNKKFIPVLFISIKEGTFRLRPKARQDTASAPMMATSNSIADWTPLKTGGF
jgi:hypothetical protein